MKHYELKNFNFLLMSDVEKEKVIEAYNSFMSRVLSESDVIVTIAQGKIYLSTDADLSAFQQCTSIPEQQVFMPDDEMNKRKMVCDKWNDKIDPMFLPLLTTRNGIAVCLTYTVLPSKDKKIKCSVYLEVFAIDEYRADGRLSEIAWFAENYGLHLYAPDKKPHKLGRKRACTSKVYGNLIPFSLCELNDKNGFEYGTDSMERRILLDRKRLDFPNGLIVGCNGSGRNSIMWNEIYQVLEKTEDSVIVIDGTDYSEKRAWDNTKVCRVFYEYYYINPMDIVISDDERLDTVEVCITVIQDFIKRKLTSYECCAVSQAVTKVIKPFEQYLKQNNIMCDFEKNPTLKNVIDELRKNGNDNCQELLNFIDSKWNLFEQFCHTTNLPTERAITLTWNTTSRVPYKAAYTACLSYVWNRLILNRQQSDKYTWVYSEDVNYVLNNELLNRIFSKASGEKTIITLCSTDFAELTSTHIGINIVGDSGFIRFLSQNHKSCEAICDIFGFTESEAKYFRNDMPCGTGLLCSGDITIPFKERW